MEREAGRRGSLGDGGRRAAAAAEKGLRGGVGELGGKSMVGEAVVVAVGMVLEVEGGGGIAKVGEESLGECFPFSTSTTLVPRLNGGAFELAGEGSSDGVAAAELDLLFQIDLDRLEMDPVGESEAKEEEAAGGGLVGVPAGGREVFEDEGEFLEERLRDLRSLEDLRLRKIWGDGEGRKVSLRNEGRKLTRGDGSRSQETARRAAIHRARSSNSLE